MAEPTIAFADLKEGQDLEPWSIENLTRTHFVRYAGASGDFNPMHHDDTVAQKVGYKSVFGHGMFTAGVLATYLERLFGIGSLRRYRVRFTGQVYPGDTLTCQATVTATRSEGSENRAEMDLRVSSGEEAVLTGTATVAVA